MAAELLTRSELSDYAARSGCSGFSNAQLDAAILRAVDQIRQAALNDYTSATVETLTSSNAPDEMRINALILALDNLTKGDAGRPQSIADSANGATRWLGFVAGGKTHYDQSPNAILVKVSGGTGATVSIAAPSKRYMNLEDPSSEMRWRDPDL